MTDDWFWSQCNNVGKFECWNWLGGTNHAGYGVFHLAGENTPDRSTEILAHAWAMRLTYPNLTFDGFSPRCENKLCVNPLHMDKYRPSTGERKLSKSKKAGYIYAYTFPSLMIGGRSSYPVKIGHTTKTVSERVKAQCGTSTFETPEILGEWWVSDCKAVEAHIHDELKSRDRWRRNCPGTEWFNTTLDEISAIISGL